MPDSDIKVKDRKTKVVNLTKYLIDLYNPKKSFALIILASAISGAIGFYITGAPILMGVLAGIWLLALPALLSGILATVVSGVAGKKLILRRSAYLSFFATLILAVLFVIGSFLPTKIYGIFDLMIFGLALVLAIRLFILNVTAMYNKALLIFLALLHPALGLASIFLYPVAVPPALVLLKITLASAIIALGSGFFITLVNAPMRRNFGITSMALANAFLSHWIDHTDDMERVLKSIGEKAETFVSIIVFRAKKKISSVYIIPYLHPGPFGYVGGGNLTRIMDGIPNSIVLHGTVTHDLNPVTAEGLANMKKEIERKIKTQDYPFFRTASRSIRAECGGAKFIGQKFGKNALIASTFSPEATEDIDFSIGLAAMCLFGKGFKETIYADAHNCYKPGDHAIYSGSREMFDILDCAEETDKRLSAEKEFKIRQGMASDPLREYSLQDGIGPTGLKVSIIEAGSQKTAHVVFDGNNMDAGLREKIIKEVKKIGIDEVEVFTTDSHCVNNIRGIENTVGQNISHAALVKRAASTAKKALLDLKEVEAGAARIPLNGVFVLGAHRSLELVSTINTMIGIMKIIAPLLFFGMLFFSLFGVLLIGW